MFETVVTIQGDIISDVAVRTTKNGYRVTTFRVACTPRRPGRTPGEWTDGPTSVYAVSCWRAMADHAADSLERGMPVLVHGRLNQRSYEREKDGVTTRTTALEIDALGVGPDLAKGVSSFRPVKSQAVRLAEQRALKDVVESLTAEEAA